MKPSRAYEEKTLIPHTNRHTKTAQTKKATIPTNNLVATTKIPHSHKQQKRTSHIPPGWLSGIQNAISIKSKAAASGLEKP
ncbi:MAG: hypothetical protein NWE98_11140 [Candidatus Bathyarchaeota archaeon]|nr:hypothetical protein [Candidatus Bathyarchaeota archaeon]